MGEAKRKKGLGHGQSAHAARTIAGEFALTLDVAGSPPSTMAMPWPDVEKLVSAFERSPDMGNVRSADQHRALRTHIATEFPKAKAAGNEKLMQSLLTATLYTVFSAPQSGGMKQAVAKMLREKDRAHVTATIAGGNFGMALSDKFVDMEKAVGSQKLDGPVVVRKDADPDKPLS